MPKIVVLRWGHRLQRDARLTTHVVLTARALGAGEDRSFSKWVCLGKKL